MFFIIINDAFTDKIQRFNEKTLVFHSVSDNLFCIKPKKTIMKQKFFILTSFIITIFLASSCIFVGPSIKGNGNVVEENRKTAEFNELKVSRGMNVYISQGSPAKIVVKADENLIKAIETQIEGNVLKVTANNNIRKATAKKVFVTTPEIRNIKSVAGSNVYSQTVIKSGRLEVSSSAGSNIKLKVNTKNLEVSSSAGSNVKLEGTTKSFSAKASAGSTIKSKDLKSSDCYAKASSGANIWVTVDNDFEGHASSGGNVFYYGNPSSTSINKSSGGNVIKK